MAYKQVEFIPPRCAHPRVENVFNGNGVMLGRQCKTCLVLLSGRGLCYGCGKREADIRIRVGAKMFCREECKAIGATKDRQAAQEKRRDQPASRQAEMPWASKAWRP